MVDGIVQEIDIATGKVLFQWNSADHVPYSDSEQPLPAAATPWDWFHINAVHLDTDGNLLIDSRATWTAFKVDRRTGAMLWRLGGKQSSFALQAAPGQTLDSAEESSPGSTIRRPSGTTSTPSSTTIRKARRATLQPGGHRAPELPHRVATLISSDDQPEGLSASSQGNAQTLRNGDIWSGGQPPLLLGVQPRASSSSTPSSPPASTPTAPTGCRRTTTQHGGTGQGITRH